MSKIQVMISSTVADLLEERQCITELFSQNPLIELIGADPYNTKSVSGSSYIETKRMSKECDLYILLLGNKYGFILDNGKSATEIEFDTAFHCDPTKILIFLKEIPGTIIDTKQKSFIERVCNYYSGYWRTTFQNKQQLQTLVNNSFERWIRERASFGENISYFDHFIRLAINRKPNESTAIYYSNKENIIELEYKILNNLITIQIQKDEILRDFWKSLYRVDEQLSVWSQL